MSINPNLVFGPPIQPPATASALNASLRPIWDILAGYGTGALASFGTHSFVDVRDVARIHLWCMEHPNQSSDKRIRAAVGLEPPQVVVDILRQAYPERDDIILQRKTGRRDLPHSVLIEGGTFVNGVQASQLATMKYMPLKQSILDTAKVMERYIER